MTDNEFDEIAEAYRASEDVRPKSKRELLAKHLAERNAGRDRARREFKCLLTPPFGHYYELMKLPTDNYNQHRCVACHRNQHGHGDSIMSPGLWGAVALSMLMVAVYLWFILFA